MLRGLRNCGRHGGVRCIQGRGIAREGEEEGGLLCECCRRGFAVLYFGGAIEGRSTNGVGEWQGPCMKPERHHGREGLDGSWPIFMAKAVEMANCGLRRQWGSLIGVLPCIDASKAAECSRCAGGV